MYIANPIYDVVFKYLMEDYPELETLLSVFDQSQAIDAERHILNLNEADFPEKFHPIIRKLHKAVQTQEIKKQMDMEDNVIDEFEELERQIEMLEERSLTAEKQKVKVEQEKHQIEQENQAVKQKLESIEGEMEKLKRLIEEMQKLK